MTACDSNVVTEFDGQLALDVMLADLHITLDQPREVLAKVRNTLVGLSQPDELLNDKPLRRAGQFGDEVVVRHIIGLDPSRKGIAIADAPSDGTTLAFGERIQILACEIVKNCPRWGQFSLRCLLPPKLLGR